MKEWKTSHILTSPGVKASLATDACYGSDNTATTRVQGIDNSNIYYETGVHGILD